MPEQGFDQMRPETTARFDRLGELLVAHMPTNRVIEAMGLLGALRRELAVSMAQRAVYRDAALGPRSEP